MQVSRISGGISNLLVKVEPPAPLQPVAVKVFGDKTELLIDRDAERHTLLRLNELGFGAKVVALFENGRIEEFLDAHTLTPDQMADPRFIPLIAARMRAFHELDMRDAVAAAAATAAANTATAAAAAADGAAAVVVPSMSPAGASSDPAAAVAAASSSSSQWDPLYGWLEMAQGLSFPHDPAKQAAFDRVDFTAVRSELTALRAACDRARSPRVFCHNDLLPGNILIVRPGTSVPLPDGKSSLPQPEQDGPLAEGGAAGSGEQQGDGVAGTEASGQQQQAPQPKRQRVDGGAAGGEVADAGGKVAPGADGQEAAAEGDVLAGGTLQFIDFEYSSYGCRGFDFGNHFNEYAGFDCVYDRFPSPEQQKLFFRHYLRPGELRRLAEQHLAAAATAKAAEADAEADAHAAKVAAAEELVLDRLVAEACVFALLSHACWGVWSYVQARYSPIDFDYLSYGEMRWAEYHRRKAEFFALVERHFPEC